MFDSLQSLTESALASGSVLVYPLLFLAGVVTSFTPCTYPVLPATVGYVGARAGGRRGAALVLSGALVLGLAVVYAAAGVVFAALGVTFGAILGNGWALAGIAFFFAAMALFLLDVFAFPTPNWAARLQTGRREGVFGAFLTGAVSGLVVGPCTGPILFVVLAFVTATLDEAATTAAYAAQAMSGGLKLFAFGVGQGTLILLCGVSAGLLTRLPRSGAWLIAVKKGFALVILVGAGLLLLYAGANTGFDPLGRALTALEPTAPSADGRAGPDEGEGAPAGVASAEATGRADRPVGGEVGQAAPRLLLERLDGDPVTVGAPASEGGALYVFFATWCPSCMAEVPAIKAFTEAARDRGVRVYGVNFRQPAEVVARFAREREVNYGLLLDSEGRAAQAYGVVGIPLLVGVDADGVVRYRAHHVPESPQAFIAMLGKVGRGRPRAAD